MAETNRIESNLIEYFRQGSVGSQRALATVKAKLLPILKTLTPDERKELSKMGEKSIPFVQKGLEWGQKIAAIVPSFIDMVEFAKDVDTVSVLSDIQRELVPIVSAIEDSLTLAGHEAYATGLLIYGGSKTAAKNGVAGAEVAANDLSTRFSGMGKKKA